MIDSKVRYSLNDIAVVPAVSSQIRSRSECNAYYQNTEKFPLFAAPMNNIINDENWRCFDNAGVNVIMPRDNEKLPYEERKERWEKFWGMGLFVAMSLNEFTEYFITNIPDELQFHSDVKKVCIDLANGHMESLISTCAKAKRLHGNSITLMTGNIANPETYLEYAKAGIDYIRCGIGTGNVCTTSANSSIHYPMASLISECKKYKDIVSTEIEQSDLYKTEYKSVPKIIADGGFCNYDQIIKALALGADYVMCGKLFSQCIEACTEIVTDNGLTIKNPYNVTEVALDLMDKGHHLAREYYGMSTKKAQKDMGGNGHKTSEGTFIKTHVKYTVKGWTNNFESYLKSAMSYTGFRALEDFIGGPHCILISPESYRAYFK